MLRRPEMSYTLRTTHTMRAMRIIVPRMPPIYIRISVNVRVPINAHPSRPVGALAHIGRRKRTSKSPPNGIFRKRGLEQRVHDVARAHLAVLAQFLAFESVACGGVRQTAHRVKMEQLFLALVWPRAAEFPTRRHPAAQCEREWSQPEIGAANALLTRNSVTSVPTRS
jgi:hypothetical protein